MKLILGYDEARKIAMTCSSMRPNLYENLRIELQPADINCHTEGRTNLEIVFEEDTSHLCSGCNEYLEECICSPAPSRYRNF